MLMLRVGHVISAAASGVGVPSGGGFGYYSRPNDVEISLRMLIK